MKINNSVINDSYTTIVGDNNKIIGNNNTVIGDNNFIHGNKNSVYGDNNFLIGVDNAVEDGFNNVIKSSETSGGTVGLKSNSWGPIGINVYNSNSFAPVDSIVKEPKQPKRKPISQAESKLFKEGVRSRVKRSPSMIEKEQLLKSNELITSHNEEPTAIRKTYSLLKSIFEFLNLLATTLMFLALGVLVGYVFNIILEFVLT